MGIASYAATDSAAYQQTGKRHLKGLVTDEAGLPVPGAAVMVQANRTIGTVTDPDGSFSMMVPGDTKVIEVSSLGYITAEVVITSQESYNVVLKEDTESLDEIVVIGYGTAKRADLTGSTSSMKGERLSNRSTPQLSSQLQGQMAGVQITRSGGDPAAGATVRVRGVTTMSTNDPLVIIDGVPGNLTDVAAEDVKDIQVLKDAASAAIYGSRAAAGVILVTTKRARSNEFKVTYNYEFSFDKPTA